MSFSLTHSIRICHNQFYFEMIDLKQSFAVAAIYVVKLHAIKKKLGPSKLFAIFIFIFLAGSTCREILI
jgi:hypothetical protein